MATSLQNQPSDSLAETNSTGDTVTPADDQTSQPKTLPCSGAPEVSDKATFSRTREDAAKWGEITIAQPKIWQYERVNSLLDALLRDVEGVSLADLTQLNPSASNAAALRFIQSALEIGVQYDEASAINARNLLQNWQAQNNSQIQQLDQYNSYMKTLLDRRDILTKQLFTAQDTVVRLQPLHDAKTTMGDQEQQLAVAQSQVTSIQSELDSVNKAISGAGSAPSLTAPPTVQNASVQQPASGSSMSSTLSSFGDMIKSLPQGIQDGLNSALKSPSYPATKQLDNFITLLYERLAREISVLQDDLTRDSNNLAYLVQFDVGLFPSGKTKDHMARVEFDLNDCPGCKVYSIYPGQNSYNVVNYKGASHRKTFWGNLQTLVGLAISASYRRQEDALRGSLVQSVYVSGFQEGAVDASFTDALQNAEKAGQRFGWYYNAAPFDQYITPGIRSTFAIITIPRSIAENGDNSHGTCLPFKIESSWPKRDDPFYQKSHWYLPETYLGVGESQKYPGSVESRLIAVRLPGTEYLEALPSVLKAEPSKLHVLRMEYNTVYHATPEAPSPPADSLTACLKGQCAGVLLELDVPVDPNLLVTVNGRPLQRVRDWRGRATSILPPAQSASDIPAPAAGAQAPAVKTQNPPSRSLLEADQLTANTWFPVSSHGILLNISRDLAGEEEFPIIQISDPAKKTLVIPNDLRQDSSEIITNGFRLIPRTPRDISRLAQITFAADPSAPARDKAPLLVGPYPYSTFLPLFRTDPPSKKVYAYVGETGEELLVGFLGGASNSSTDEKSHHFSWLEMHTQVILEDKESDLAWSLSCRPQGSELACKLPIDAIRTSYLEIWKVCQGTGTDEPGTCRALQKRLDSFKGLQRSVTDLARANNIFMADLQVSVEQYDPENIDHFYSAEPAAVGLFPLSGDYTGDDRLFRPWHFLSADQSQIRVEECNYFPGGGNVTVALLGAADPASAVQTLSPPTQPCDSIRLDTLTLQRDPIVLRIKRLSDEVAWIAQIPAARLRPEFGRPRIQPIRSAGANGPYGIVSWDIFVPVYRADCGDGRELNALATSIGTSNFNWRWRIGDTEGKECVLFRDTDGNRMRVLRPEAAPEANHTSRLADWDRATRDGRVQLHLTLSKKAARQLPSEIHLLRGDDEIPVATLPNLQKLVLPSKLTLQSLSDYQFVLRGENAGAIDSVSLSDGKTAWKYNTAPGSDFALVTIEKSDSTACKAASSSPGGGTTIDSAQNQARAPAKAPAKKAPAAKVPPPCPGTYAVLPLILTDTNTYVPVNSTTDQNSPLTFTVPKPSDSNRSDGTDAKSDITTTKITKTIETTKTPGSANSMTPKPKQ